MTPAELLHRLQKRSIPPQDFLEEFTRLSDGSELEARTYAPGELTLYRTKELEKEALPTTVQDLSYPPRDKSELQRANLENEQVFYGSIQMDAALSEGRVSAGDRIVVSRWKNAKELSVRAIPTEPSSDTERIYNLLYTDLDTSIYPYSAAVAHRLFKTHPMLGLLYPSRRDEAENENVALTARATDEILALEDATLCEVTKAKTDSYEVKELNVAVPDGDSLKWLGTTV